MRRYAMLGAERVKLPDWLVIAKLEAQVESLRWARRYDRACFKILLAGKKITRKLLLEQLT